ncbi:EEF1A lysine methyltransferase 4 isoform X2 [Chiloscyllium plagiosum]|uniref:EEF1A lysine methyltransferase 4 isoform X2 n=1 Tax=Chiloscyllium plagiosum TaxID=36176 RepID=UPI001CB7C454|nr:EEF1A lysine methyltransferase 4 isoform X2 [Chiloscyllium plagiosum]
MDNLPISNSRYKDRNYWDERYHHEETYEWFGAFSRFEHLLKEEIQTDETILVLGCGNSSLSYEMFMSGYRSITNIDFSAICIEKMASKYATCSGMEWKVMDAKALQFEDESFDVVLEKGTLDAMMVDEKDPWNVSQETTETIDQVLKEIPCGQFLCNLLLLSECSMLLSSELIKLLLNLQLLSDILSWLGVLIPLLQASNDHHHS